MHAVRERRELPGAKEKTVRARILTPESSDERCIGRVKPIYRNSRQLRLLVAGGVGGKPNSNNGNECENKPDFGHTPPDSLPRNDWRHTVSSCYRAFAMLRSL